MDTLTNILDNSELLSFGILVAILYLLGTKVATQGSAARRWGLRFALLAFVAYGVYGVTKLRSPDAGDLAALAFRGLFVAGLVLGLSWVLLPIGAFLYRHTIAGPASAARRAMDAASRRAEERRAQEEEERRQRVAQAEWERGAPERERKRRDQEAIAAAQAGEQRRREVARANCLVLYGLYGPDIKERFPRMMLDEFLQTYMTDTRSADFVEERAEQLQTLLRQHYEAVHPPPKFRSLADIASYFQGQLQDIASLAIDDKMKRMLIAITNRQQAETITNFLNRSSEP